MLNGSVSNRMIAAAFAAVLLFFLHPFPSIAETVADTADMEEVVVSAEKLDRKTETGDVNLETTTSFYSLITREEFEGKIDNLGEVLEKEAGVQVRQTGGLGSFSTVSLRGSSSDEVMIFLDGILLNDASGGGVDLSTISLSDVDSIEVFRGSTPLSFGKSSIGGVVNIRTLRSGNKLGGNLTGGYGSFGTWKGSGFVNDKRGKWDYLISANYLQSDNDFKFLNDMGTTWNPKDDRTQRRNNAWFHENNFLGKVGYDLTRNARIDLMNQWFSKAQGLPAWSNSDLVKTRFDTDRNLATMKFTVNDLSPYHLNTSTFVDYLHKVEKYDDSEGSIGLGTQLNRYTTDRYGGHFVLDWPTAWSTLTLMMDAQVETYDPKDLLNPENNIRNSSRDSFAIGMQDNIFLFNEKLIVTPALRYTYIHDKRLSAVDYWGRPLDGNTVEEGSWNPQLGVKYRMLDWLALKSNLGQYVRQPSFYELFGDRGLFIGNPDLKSEKGTNFDIGFEAGRVWRDKWLNSVTLGAAFFHNTVDDLISRVYDARGVGKAVNISSSLIEGVELTLKVEFLKHFRFIGNATWQDPTQKNEIEAFDGKILPGRFQESFLGRIEAFYGPAKVYAEYAVDKGMFYDTANLLPAKNKEEINLGASYQFRSFIVTIEAKNITGMQYEDFNGYPMPGRSGYLTVRYQF